MEEGGSKREEIKSKRRKMNAGNGGRREEREYPREKRGE